MSLWERVTRHLGARRGATARRRRRPDPVRPTLVALEDRLTPTVTNLMDRDPPLPNSGTLRWECSQGGAVTFAATLSGVIHLAPGAGPIQFPPGNTTVTGNLNSVTVDGRNQTRIFHVPQGANVTIDNLIVTNGFARAPNQNTGGAILNEGNLTVDSDVFEYNRAYSNGGAIETTPRTGASLTVNYCTFTGNRAITGFGGALSTNDGWRDGGNVSVSVYWSTFEANEAARGGGAIDFEPPALVFGAANLTVYSSTFQGNEGSDGGGIYATDTAQGGVESLDLEWNSFTANGANGTLISGGYGGALDLALSLSGSAQASVYVLGGDYADGNVTGFTGNWANYGGAISTVVRTAPNSVSSAQVLIDQVEVSSNQAVWGGGIYNDLNGGSVNPSGDPTPLTTIALTHSTVDDNVATSLSVGASSVDGDGGGAYANVRGNAWTELRYVNDTFAYNSAVTSSSAAGSTGNGGGIYLTGSNPMQVPAVFLNSLTVAYNLAFYYGGGLWTGLPGTGPTLIPVLRNSAFCANTALLSVGGQDGYCTVTTGGYNTVSNNSQFIGLNTASPFFDIVNTSCNLNMALAANGGWTLTLWPNLLPTSPLRGMGFSFPPLPQYRDPTDDQRGVPRSNPTTRGAVDPGPGVLPAPPAGADGLSPALGPLDPGVVAGLLGLRRDPALAPGGEDAAAD
jgi:hypothetical protein